jgi:hypothetical protein
MMGLNMTEQRSLLHQGTLTVRRRDGDAIVPIEKITAADASRAIDAVAGRVLPPGAQRNVRQIKGRPPRMRTIVLTMSEDVHAKLQAEAARTNRSASSLVMKILENDGVLSQRSGTSL